MPVTLFDAPGSRLELDPAPVHRLGQEDPEPVQLSFGDLGPDLFDVTFCVVDLETTGDRPGPRSITEFGAVKVRGGEIVDEFTSLVNPQVPIPAFITFLTGITTAMVATAPPIEAVMPAFLDFLGNDPDVVLVAHNARFDVSHLKAAATGIEVPFPHLKVIDTWKLATRVFTKDEVPNFKLGTLAGFCGASVTPNHRALDDARATVDVLHAILARLGGIGVTHLADLLTATDPVPQSRRKKAYLADSLPHGPGVYKFIGPAEDVLYVGTSHNVYKRVRQYFTAAEKRKRIAEMVDISLRVEAISTATVLEANILELRLIDELDPPYNRRSRRSQSRPWLVLTSEPHPRLKISRKISAELLDSAVGPFSSTSQAKDAAQLISDVTGLRPCTERLPTTGGKSACHLYELGKCSAPCLSGVPQRAALSAAARVLTGDLREVSQAELKRLKQLGKEERFEQAAIERDRLYSLVRGTKKSAVLRPLLRSPRLIATAPNKKGWDVIVVDYGRLRASGATKSGENPEELAEFLNRTHSPLAPPDYATAHAPIDEVDLIYQWLARRGVRFLQVPEPNQLRMNRFGAHGLDLPEVLRWDSRDRNP